MPARTFASLGLDRRLMAGCDDMGYAETRQVQTAVIPLALDGRDVVACAETGTGKTLGFVIPILQRLLAEVRLYGDAAREPYSRALILAPTRELAAQIEDTIVGLTYHTPCSSVPVYGGVEMWPQERALKAGVDIVVATPGRLMDHMRHGEKGLIPAKLFEYLAARKTIICLGPADSEAAKIIEECDAGKTFERNNEEGLLKYFEQLVTKWKINKDLDVKNTSYQKFSRYNQTKKLSEIILDHRLRR